MDIMTWNVAWRSPVSDVGREIAARISAARPDIVCLTETPGDYVTGKPVTTIDPHSPDVCGGPGRCSVQSCCAQT